MTTIPFDSVHAALAWYFGRTWVKDSKPADARSIDLTRDLGGKKQPYNPRGGDTEKVWNAARGIFLVVDGLTARNQYILAQHYEKRGATQAEVALSYGLLGGDRSVRRIREEVLNKVEIDLITAGIVRLPKPGEMKYAAETTDDG